MEKAKWKPFLLGDSARPGFCLRFLSDLYVCTRVCVCVCVCVFLSVSLCTDCQVESCSRPFSAPLLSDVSLLSSPAADPCWFPPALKCMMPLPSIPSSAGEITFLQIAHECAHTDLICLRLMLKLSDTSPALPRSCEFVPASALHICINTSLWFGFSYCTWSLSKTLCVVNHIHRLAALNPRGGGTLTVFWHDMEAF